MFSSHLRTGPRRRRLFGACLGTALVAFFFLPALSWAQDLPDAAIDPGANSEISQEQREDIRIVGFRDQKDGVENTVPAIFLDDRALEDSIPEVLTDALKGARAVHLQVTTPGQGSPFLRGLTGSGVLNLVDGMRLNNAIYRAAPTPYIALVEPRLVESIEIVRGPASVRHGSDAMGGVIQLHTRRPIFQDEDWQSRASLSALFNSANLGRGMRAEVESGNTQLGIRAGFSGLETGNLEGGGDVGRQVPSAYTSLGGDFSVFWAPQTNRTLSLDVQYNKQPKTPRYDEMTTGFGQTHPSSSEFYYEPLERLFAHMRYEQEEESRYFDSVRFDVAYQRIRDDRLTRDYESAIRSHEKNSSELLGIFGVVRKRIGNKINLHWGADAYLDWVSSSRRDTNINTGVEVNVPSRFPDGSTMNTYGVHADMSMHILPMLSLDAGIRYSYIETRLPNSALGTVERGDQQDFTGSVGLLLEPWESVEFITSFRRGFRAPNIFDLGALGPRPGNRYNEPNTDLAPEVIYTTDLGFRYLGETIQTEIFFYYSRYDDKIESVPTGGQTPDGRDIVKSANTKKVQLTGVEFFENIRLNESLSMAFSFFWTWGEQSIRTGGEEPADRIPPLQGKLGFPWQASERLRIEPYLRFAASQRRLSERDIRDPRINPLGTPSWATVNISGQFQWSERLSFSAELRNLSNANYREHGSGIQAPGIGAACSFQLTY